MAEFKRLSDVEVVAVPAESANVLIEENGVIKKAPKTAVGGAGAVEWDAIFEVVEGSSGYFASIDLIFGNYQDLANKLDNNIFPNVLIKFAEGNNYGLLKPTSIILDNNYYSDNIGIMFSFLCGYNQRKFFLLENGETSNY